MFFPVSLDYIRLLRPLSWTRTMPKWNTAKQVRFAPGGSNPFLYLQYLALLTIPYLYFFLIYFLKILFIWERVKERQRERTRVSKGRGRGRGKESQADSALSMEPDPGLDLMTLTSRPELKPRVWRWTNWATRVPLFFLVLISIQLLLLSCTLSRTYYIQLASFSHQTSVESRNSVILYYPEECFTKSSAVLFISSLR